jgi:putative polyhydroxyalkanoate system protein
VRRIPTAVLVKLESRYFYNIQPNNNRGKIMADISLTRKHQLGLKGAKTAADKMSARLNEKFDLISTWTGDTLHFQRSGVNGKMLVSATHMELEVTLGFLLKAMKGPIEKAVVENLDGALASAKPVETTSAKAPAKPATKTAAKKTTTKKA